MSPGSGFGRLRSRSFWCRMSTSVPLSVGYARRPSRPRTGRTGTRRSSPKRLDGLGGGVPDPESVGAAVVVRDHGAGDAVGEADRRRGDRIVARRRRPCRRRRSPSTMMPSAALAVTARPPRPFGAGAQPPRHPADRLLGVDPLGVRQRERALGALRSSKASLVELGEVGRGVGCVGFGGAAVGGARLSHDGSNVEEAPDISPEPARHYTVPDNRQSLDTADRPRHRPKAGVRPKGGVGDA